MSSQDWTRWFPARIGDTALWRVIRFDAVNAENQPLGSAIEYKTPAGATAKFPNEQRAQWAANALNDGKAW